MRHDAAAVGISVGEFSASRSLSFPLLLNCASDIFRNLRTDVTRFVPTNVKLAKKQQRQSDPMTDVFKPPQPKQPQPFQQQQQPQQQQQQSKDDAYAQFMSEMDQLLK